MTGSALTRWTLHPEVLGGRIYISFILGEGSGEGKEQKIRPRAEAGGFIDIDDNYTLWHRFGSVELPNHCFYKVLGA